MRTTRDVEIAAPAALVWDLYADVERWPEWTDSVTTLTGIDGAELELGRRFRIKQPRMPALVWTVTELTPGVSWTWEQRSPGGRTAGVHEVVAVADDRTLVRQQLDQEGWLGARFGRVLRGMTGRYLDMEAAGLKGHCEGHHRATG